MSLSAQQFPSIPPKNVALQSQIETLRQRIQGIKDLKIENSPVKGHESETDPARIAKIKASRLAMLQPVLRQLEQQLQELEQTEASTPKTLQEPTSPASEVHSKDDYEVVGLQRSREFVSASQLHGTPANLNPSDRSIYNEFEKEHLLPALKKYEESPLGVEEKNVLDTFINMATLLQSMYDQKNLKTGRFMDYLSGGQILQHPLLIALNLGLAKIIWDKVNNKIPEKLEKALGQIKEFGLDPYNDQPLFPITCNAERDFVLLLNKFIDFFVLSKNPSIQFQNSLANNLLGKTGVSNKIPAIKKYRPLIERRFKRLNERIWSFENGELLSPSSISSPHRNSSNLNSDNSISNFENGELLSPSSISSPHRTSSHSSSENSHDESKSTSISSPPISRQSSTENLSEESSSNPSLSTFSRSASSLGLPSLIPAPSTNEEAKLLDESASLAPSPKQSFFARHKKKILWGFGIGLVIGIGIATAGGLTGVAALVALAIAGVKTLASTIGFGAAAAVSVGLVGGVIGASYGALKDCTSSTPSPDPVVVKPQPKKGLDTKQIHAATDMPILPAVVPTPVLAQSPQSEPSASACKQHKPKPHLTIDIRPRAGINK